MTELSARLGQVVGDPAELRVFLEEHYGRSDTTTLSPWERVEMALAHSQPDRVPFDFWAVPEVWERIRRALDLGDDVSTADEELLRLLGVDCRMVKTRYTGAKARELSDGTYIDAWGTHRREMSNEFSTYGEYASHPLAEAETALAAANLIGDGLFGVDVKDTVGAIVSVVLGVGVVEPGPGDDEQHVRVARANKASERPLAPAALDLQTSDMLTSHRWCIGCAHGVQL